MPGAALILHSAGVNAAAGFFCMPATTWQIGLLEQAKLLPYCPLRRFERREGRGLPASDHCIARLYIDRVGLGRTRAAKDPLDRFSLPNPAPLHDGDHRVHLGMEAD